MKNLPLSALGRGLRGGFKTGKLFDHGSLVIVEKCKKANKKWFFSVKCVNMKF